MSMAFAGLHILPPLLRSLERQPYSMNSDYRKKNLTIREIWNSDRAGDLAPGAHLACGDETIASPSPPLSKK